MYNNICSCTPWKGMSEQDCKDLASRWMATDLKDTYGNVISSAPCKQYWRNGVRPARPVIWVGRGCNSPCYTRAVAQNKDPVKYCRSVHSPLTDSSGGCKFYGVSTIDCLGQNPCTDCKNNVPPCAVSNYPSTCPAATCDMGCPNACRANPACKWENFQCHRRAVCFS
jgi:hypothetical protein